MSIRVMSRVWDHSRHKGSALLLLLAIADNANEAGEAWPSIDTLAKKVRMTDRNVQMLVQRLVDSGELQVEPGGGKHHTNHYRVTLNGEATNTEKFSPLATPNGEKSRANGEKSGGQTVKNPVAKGERATSPEPGEPSSEPSLEPGDRARSARTRENGVGAPQAPTETTKTGDVVTRVKAEGIPITISSRDGKAIKDCNASAEQIAAAYVAAYRGTWGDEFIRSNLSVHLVVDRLAGFLASTNGRSPARAAGAFAFMEKTA